MNNDIISVIIPCYNTGKYLDECINSVLQSTYQKFEIILINDGSTDNTLDICKKYAEADERIKYFTQENQGVSVARNVGLDNASGEYIYFLDSDDLLTSDGLQVLYNNIVELKADICSGTIKAFKSLNELNETNDEMHDYKQEVFTGTDGINLCIKDDFKIYALPGKLFRRQFVNSSRFVPKMRSHEDSYFVFEQMLKEPKFVFTTQRICNIRINSGSTTHADFSDKYEDILFLADLKVKRLNEQYPELKNINNKKIKAYMSVLSNTKKYSTSKYHDVEKEAIKYIKQNRHSFIPIDKNDDRLFFIITHHLYFLFKKIYKML